jgi:hypothetical protein
MSDWPELVFGTWAAGGILLATLAPGRLRKAGRWESLSPADIAFLALLIVAWPALLIADWLGFLPGKKGGE